MNLLSLRTSYTRTETEEKVLKLNFCTKRKLLNCITLAFIFVFLLANSVYNCLCTFAL